MFYVVKSDGQVIGYFHSQPQAVAAMEEERGKKDGTELSMEQIKEEGDRDGKESETRY